MRILRFLTIPLIGGIFLIGFFSLVATIEGVFLTTFLLKKPHSDAVMRARALLQCSLRLFLWMLRKGRICSVLWEEQLRLTSGSCLIVANHPSLLDIFILLATIPSPTTVAKASLWKVPFLGRLLTRLGYLSNKESGSLIPQCVAALENGGRLILFPEGTRSAQGVLIKEFQPGVGAIALRSKAPVLPIVMRVLPPMLFKGQSWTRPLFQQFEFRLCPCHPLIPAGKALFPQEERALRKEFTAELNRFFSEKLQND